MMEYVQLRFGRHHTAGLGGLGGRGDVGFLAFLGCGCRSRSRLGLWRCGRFRRWARGAGGGESGMLRRKEGSGRGCQLMESEHVCLRARSMSEGEG